MKHILFIFLFAFFFDNTYADFDKNAFLNKFKEADYKEKVRLVANTNFNDIKEIYPQIKDTLEKIKKYVYTHTSSNEAKFLFDIIEAKISKHNGQFSKCIAIINNSLHYHCDNINDSITSLVLLKECLIQINDYNKALEIQKIIENNWNRKTNALWMGTPKSNIYSYLGLYKYAIVERKREYEQGSHDNWETARLYNDIGVFYNRMEKYDSAEVYFLKALNELKKYNKNNIDTNYYNFFVSLIKSNLAVDYIKKKRYTEALPYLLTDVTNSLKNKEYESAFNAYTGLIEIYININKFDIAKKYLDTLDILDIPEFRYPKNLVKKYYWQSIYYEKIGEIQKSLNYLKLYTKLYDSTRKIEQEIQAINASIAYQVQEKDNALKEKTSALAILKIEQEKDNIIKKYLIIFIIILLIGGFILFKYYREVQKHSIELKEANKTVYQQNKLIQKSLLEKEMLIKEIHHRVKNNLQIINSIIRLQMNKETDNKTQNILNEVSTRIQSIALTHQMLYKKENLLKINAIEYLNNLSNQIFSAFSNNKEVQMSFYHNNENCELPLDVAIPLGLICSEVITNAIKYAFPDNKGRIDIIFNCDEDNTCSLTISDNGIGIDLNKTNKTGSLGMELIKILSEQIEAYYTFKVNNGTIFEIKIKIKK